MTLVNVSVLESCKLFTIPVATGAACLFRAMLRTMMTQPIAYK